MENKNLFSAIKTFINNTPVGQTFTTKQLIAAVGSNETLTRWKAVNSNPFYRTHTYKAYLRRTGFLSFIKRGEWKVEKHIPESYNLGTIEFLIGYKGKTYNGMTREEILNPQLLFTSGDMLVFSNTNVKRMYSAQSGAKAIFKGFVDWTEGELIKVEWIRDGLDNKQDDGGYFISDFVKVEEVSTQKEDRIFEENKKKVMKLKVGDIVKLENNDIMGAKKGATAKVTYVDNDAWVTVVWLDDLSFGQEDGEYDISRFTKIKEEASQKEDRIFEENKKKVMKFNFEEGKQRVTAMMSERVDNFTHDMLQDIRLVINEDRDETLDQIEGIIESIRYTKRNIENATERVKSAIYIREVLEAMENTMFEEMEETVLGELFNVDIVID